MPLFATGHQSLSIFVHFVPNLLSAVDPVSTVASDMSPTRSKIRKQSSLLAIQKVPRLLDGALSVYLTAR